MTTGSDPWMDGIRRESLSTLFQDRQTESRFKDERAGQGGDPDLAVVRKVPQDHSLRSPNPQEADEAIERFPRTEGMGH